MTIFYFIGTGDSLAVAKRFDGLLSGETPKSR